MRFLVIMIVLFATTTAQAQTIAMAFEQARQEHRLAKDDFAFERMKARSNYWTDLQKVKPGEFFILWANYDDPETYAAITKAYPNAIHSWTEHTTQVKDGLVIGRYYDGKTVERLKDIDGLRVESKGVITLLESLNGSPRVETPLLNQSLSSPVAPVVTKSTGAPISIVQNKVASTPPRAYPRDYHSHTCPKCGTTWWHSSSDPHASHNCPNCGKYQNVISSHGPPPATATPYYASKQQPQLIKLSGCANGNCSIR